jgi:hypothetical protein
LDKRVYERRISKSAKSFAVCEFPAVAWVPFQMSRGTLSYQAFRGARHFFIRTRRKLVQEVVAVAPELPDG